MSYHTANKPRIIAQVHKHELRLRMDAAIGRAPPITDAEIQVCHGLELRVCAAIMPAILSSLRGCSGQAVRLDGNVPAIRCSKDGRHQCFHGVLILSIARAAAPFSYLEVLGLCWATVQCIQDGCAAAAVQQAPKLYLAKTGSHPTCCAPPGGAAP